MSAAGCEPRRAGPGSRAGSLSPSMWSTRTPAIALVATERHDQLVGPLAHLRVLHAHADQPVDVEEAAVVPRPGLRPPVGRPEMLSQPTARRADLRTSAVRGRGGTPGRPGRAPRRRFVGGGGPPAERARGRPERCRARGHRAGSSRCRRSASGRGLALAEDLPPPVVGGVGGHVVGHDVEEQAHAVVSELVEQGFEVVRPTPGRGRGARGRSRRSRGCCPARPPGSARRRGSRSPGRPGTGRARAPRPSPARGVAAGRWSREPAGVIVRFRSLWRSNSVEWALSETASVRTMRPQGPGWAVLRTSSQMPASSMSGQRVGTGTCPGVEQDEQ